MKLVGYVRKTRSEGAEGFALAGQEKAIQQWAKANRHKLVKILVDDGVNGTTPATEREGLTEALDLIAQRKPGTDWRAAEGLVVRDLDRLARALDVQEAILATVWKYDGHVFDCGQGEIRRDDPDDPARMIV